MMEHALLNDESELGGSWGLTGGMFLAGSLEGQGGTEGGRPTQHPISERKRQACVRPRPGLTSLPSPGVLKEIQSTLEGDRG